MFNLLQKEFNTQNTKNLRNSTENYKLYQNFPQSFYKVTMIAFEIPAETNVRLVIYDVFGQDKEILVNGTLKEGSYELKWNATNLNAGIYYYKLYAGDFVDSKKIFLLKN